MSRTRVLIIEDSLTVRRRLVEVLSSSSGFEVAGEAGDGRAGIEMCERLRPDVVTCDMVLPVMSGLSATEYIMAYCPTPIVIVSSSFNRGELFRTYDALAAGAVDVLEKPHGDEFDGSWETNLLASLRLAARIKVITHPRARLRRPVTPLPAPPAGIPAAAGEQDYALVALGASTGGPAALVEILGALPSTFPLPILVVLHIGRPFGLAIAEWLDGLTALRVAQAVDGEALPPPGDSRILLAPPDSHLVVDRGRLRLTDDPERHSCRPSVDVLFESIALELGGRAIAGLLTGMGCDGAAGLLALHRAGAMTLAQDEATSVVFGMPREAIALGAARQVLPAWQFAPAIMRLAGRREIARRSP